MSCLCKFCNGSTNLNMLLCIPALFLHIIDVTFLPVKLISILTMLTFFLRKGKKKRDRSPSSSSSSSSPSPYPPQFRGKEYMGEGMEQSEEGYSHPRYPPRDISGPGDRGPRDYEGHGTERGRGRGFVSSRLCSVHFFCCTCFFVFVLFFFH